MAGVFDEKAMNEVLKEYIPDGENMIAGIHALGLQVHIKQVLRDCLFNGKMYTANENMLLEIKKQKEATYGIYLGITEHYLVIKECEPCRYFYEMKEIQDTREILGENMDSVSSEKDIGTCFQLADIKDCLIKNGFMGSYKCIITFKNGTLLKLLLPKLAGVGGGMPHHKEYREAIVTRLKMF